MRALSQREPLSCRHPQGTAPIPYLASTSLPPSDFIWPRPESGLAGSLGYCSSFPAAHGVPLSSYCITQKTRVYLLQTAHTLEKKGKGFRRIILQLQYWKDMEINQLTPGYTSSLWQRHELNKNPPNPMLVPLLQAFPLCLWRSVFTFQGQSKENGSAALFPSYSTRWKWGLQHSLVGLKTEHLEQQCQVGSLFWQLMKMCYRPDTFCSPAAASCFHLLNCLDHLLIPSPQHIWQSYREVDTWASRADLPSLALFLTNACITTEHLLHVL